jgi:hypothetical protein
MKFSVLRQHPPCRFYLALVTSVMGLQFFCSSPARAQFHVGPIATATGGAGRAAIDPGEISYLNPAAVAFLRSYYMDAGIGLTTHATLGDSKEWGVLAADNSEGELVAGSISYQRRNQDYLSGHSALIQDIQASVAGFVGSHFAIGGSVHRLNYNPSQGARTIQTNLNLGVLWAVTPSVGVGVTALDILPLSEDVAAAIRLSPSYGFGTNWIIRQFLHLRFDFVRRTEFNYERTNFMAGFETYFTENFAFRAGSDWEETENQTWITTGLGFKGPKLSFNYTYAKDIRQAKGSRHLFDLWMPF